MNLPLDVPAWPAFGREAFEHKIKTVLPNLVYDDLYTLNTQSGTQWDGFRHFAHLATQTFYNGTKGADIDGPDANLRCSVHWLAEHGIAARGLLLDFASWAQKTGRKYDPSGHDSITYDDLVAVGKDQGVDIRPAAQGGDVQIGDILFVRSGWVPEYYKQTPEERKRLGLRHSALGPENEVLFSGLAQEEKMLDWLHDSYFAAVAGDAPALEAWPSKTGE